MLWFRGGHLCASWRYLPEQIFCTWVGQKWRWEILELGDDVKQSAPGPCLLAHSAAALCRGSCWLLVQSP